MMSLILLNTLLALITLMQNFCSVLLSNLVKKKVQGFSQKDEVLTREYELVREALFTDEDDQSGWFYHLWLLDQTVKAESPLLASSWPANGSDLVLLGDRCLDSCTSSPFNTFQFDSRTFPLILYFNQPVEGVNSSTITVSSEFNTNKDVIWKPISTINSTAAKVWVAQLNFPDVELHSVEACPVEVTLGHSQGIISSSGTNFSHSSSFAFTVRVQPIKTELAEGSGLEKISWRDVNFHIYEPHSPESDVVVPIHRLNIKNKHDSTSSTWQAKIIAEEIEHFRDLLDW